MGTFFLYWAVKRPIRAVKHPDTSRAEVKERVELYLYSPSGPSRPVIERILQFFITQFTLIGRYWTMSEFKISVLEIEGGKESENIEVRVLFC